MIDVFKNVKRLERENAGLREMLKRPLRRAVAAGAMDARAMQSALAVSEQEPLLRAVLQIMDGQREELVQDAGLPNLEPVESMARSRAAAALMESADEIVALVRQANRARATGEIASEQGDGD
jgi:hypothetical protein